MTLFREHDMKPDMIDELDHHLLLQMGISKTGHRIKILRGKLIDSATKESIENKESSPIKPKCANESN